MKKILSVILAITMLFATLSLTACGQAPAEVIENAFEKTENLDSYHAVMETSISMGGGGFSVEIPMTIEYKVEGAKSQNPKLYAKSIVEVLGESVTVETYMAGGWMYVVQGDNKFKADISKIDDVDDYDYSAFMEGIMQELPEDLLKNVEFKVEDGAKTVTVNIPDATFKQVFDDFLEEMGELALQDEFDKLTTSNATVSMSVKDGYISDYSMEYTMTLGMDGINMDANVSASVSFKNPGEKVSVTVPSDADSYMDATASMS